MVIDSITLPDILQWVDEFNWSPVLHNVQYSVKGSLFIQESTKQAGRIITLQGSESYGLVPRSTIESLQTSRNTADNEFTLILRDAREFTVRWYNADSSALDVKPYVEYNQYDSSSLWIINSLKFIEV